MKYTCAACGLTFDSAWSDEEAKLELKEVFGDVSSKDCNIVCDDCYLEMSRGFLILASKDNIG